MLLFCDIVAVMNAFAVKLKENLMAVAPISVIVLILHFTIVPLETLLLARFLIGAVLVVFGLSFFLIGVDIGITPLGSQTGASLAKTNTLWIVVVAGLILGFFISMAEPGLIVLADQVGEVTHQQISSVSILLVVSVGLAVMLSLGFVRIFSSFPLHWMLIIIYAVIAALAIFTSPEFLGIAFDASGATTGIMAVPFILALAVGISTLKRDSDKSESDSFGLVALASAGAIIGVMILNILTAATEYSAELELPSAGYGSVFDLFFHKLPGILQEGLTALSPLIVVLIVMQIFAFKLSRRAFRRMLLGFIYAFIGLLLFFLGVYGGFMIVGAMVGHTLAAMDNKIFLLLTGFLIGLVTMLAEPAVYVQTHQIEDVTSGYVKRVAVLIPLCLGVGIAILLSMLRIVIPSISLWHFLLPGYILALGMTFFTPKLFVGIAFDAGGVATGPMTATFTLAFAQGAAAAFDGANLLIEGFGMIAMVAMMPIITLQILGIIFGKMSKKRGIE